MTTLAPDRIDTQEPQATAMRLRLRALSFDHATFDLHDTFGFARAATVAVGSGNSWHDCCRFPNLSHGEAGESTGDAGLDQEIRERAGDLLTLLESTTNVRAAA